MARLTTFLPILAAALPLGIVLFHYLIRRGLAPARVIEQGTPGDFGLAYEEIHVVTEDNRRLFGWFMAGREPGPSPAVVMMHGWGGNAETLLPLAPFLAKAGYAVLALDARCHGRSDEDHFVSMPRFAEDLDHAIDWMRRHEAIDPQCIAIIGHSVGAGAALMSAARRNDIAAVISIAAFAHPAGMMRRLLASSHIPYWPVGWYILRYVQQVIGHRFDEIAPLATIRQVRCPVLLVHGTEDKTVPVEDAQAIYASRGAARVQLQVIPGNHCEYGDLSQHAPLLVSFLENAQ